MQTAFIYWNIAPEAFYLFGIPVRYYGLLFVGGFIAGYNLIEWIYKREHIPLSKLNRLTLYVLIGAFAGARLGHCLFYEPEYFLSHPLEMFFPIGYAEDGSIVFKAYTGLASHGGAFGVLLSILIYKWRTKEEIVLPLDIIAIATPLAGFFIRMANFFNSEIIGYPTDVPWAIVFEQVDEQPRHPAQLYEAVFYLCLFVVMFLLYKRKGLWAVTSSLASGEKKPADGRGLQFRPSPGFYFALSMGGIFAFRFFVEFIKERQVDFEYGLPLDMGQILSIPVILIAIAVLIYGKKFNRKERREGAEIN